MQVVILAGGLGTRLGAMTRSVPKPMVPVAGRPFLERQIAFLAAQGLRRILLLTGYLGGQLESHFGDGSRQGLEIRYAREEEPQGTGGALRRALDLLDTRFLLLYGDSFLPVLYPALVQAFRGRPDAGGMMAVFRDAEAATGVTPNVALDAAGRVTRYAKGRVDPELRYIEAGAIALTADAVRRIPAGRKAAVEEDVYPDLVGEGRMYGWVTKQRFYDIGTPEGLARAEEFFRSGATTG